MQIVNSLNNNENTPIALTIGNFDGVHCGHQAILKTLVNAATKMNCQPAVMTFSPHAKVFFTHIVDFLICSDEEKAALIDQHNIQTLFQIPFDRQFSETTEADFVKLLIEDINVKYLLVGDDFRFGHQGRGNYDSLAAICEKHDVIIESTQTIRYADERISSSRVRTAIKDSNFELVSVLLGRKLTYAGTVISGKQLGRTINYPTANIRLPELRLLPSGVFAVRVTIDKEQTIYQGMCNIGHKPTVDDQEIRQIETHLFDFSGHLYGRALTIHLVAKIRDEQKFSGIDALVAQLHHDKVKSIECLNTAQQ